METFIYATSAQIKALNHIPSSESSKKIFFSQDKLLLARIFLLGGYKNKNSQEITDKKVWPSWLQTLKSFNPHIGIQVLISIEKCIGK